MEPEELRRRASRYREIAGRMTEPRATKALKELAAGMRPVPRIPKRHTLVPLQRKTGRKIERVCGADADRLGSPTTSRKGA